MAYRGDPSAHPSVRTPPGVGVTTPHSMIPIPSPLRATCNLVVIRDGARWSKALSDDPPRDADVQQFALKILAQTQRPIHEGLME